MFVRKKLVMLDTTTTTMTTATMTTTTATLSLMTDHALLIGSNNIYYFGWSNSSEHNSAARLIIFRCCFVTFFYGGIFFLSSLRSWWHCFVSWKKYSPIKRVYSGVILKHWRAADRGLMIWKKRIRKHIWTQSLLFRAEVFLIKLQLTSSIWSEAYSLVCRVHQFLTFKRKTSNKIEIRPVWLRLTEFCADPGLDPGGPKRN